jgi:hypothetical protein
MLAQRHHLELCVAPQSWTGLGRVFLRVLVIASEHERPSTKTV